MSKKYAVVRTPVGVKKLRVIKAAKNGRVFVRHWCESGAWRVPGKWIDPEDVIKLTCNPDGECSPPTRKANRSQKSLEGLADVIA